MASCVSALSSIVANGHQVLPTFPPPPRFIPYGGFSPGNVVRHILLKGSGAAAIFFIDSGQATVSSKGVHLATLGTGDYFGEIALIDGGPSSAMVTAATDLVCYGLTFWEFRPLIERNGALRWKLLQALAKRLRAAAPRASQIN